MKIRCPKPPLEHKQILQQQRTEVRWQLSLRQISVLQNSWSTTLPSCGNSMLYSRMNEVKSVANEASTPHPEITVGLMATKLVALTRVSLANSLTPATKRRPLERITWEVGRPTGNDVQGRQLNYSHSCNPRCAPARTHRQIQAPREQPN
jgi:hypothetical protein